MSIKRMTKVWDESPFEGTRLLIHLALADTSHDDGRFFASQQQLADKCRCTTQYVRLVINEMIEQGFMEIVTKGSSRGKATVYQFLEKKPPISVMESEPAENTNSQTPEINSQTLTDQLPNSIEQHPSYTSVLSTTTEFDLFWEIYPIHNGGKPDAQNALKKALKKVALEIILEGTRKYRDDPNRSKSHTAYAASWLNQERWDDPPLPPQSLRTGARAVLQSPTPIPIRFSEADRPKRLPVPENIRGSL